MTSTETPIKHTEASVLRLLRERHAPKRAGNGPEWAYLEKVRNAAGFDATRTADAMALHLWPSRGHELHGFEVKVSRSDWKTELANPAKAEVWTGMVDRWWVVAPKGIVQQDELPATWGLLEVSPDGGKLKQAVAAPLLTDTRHSISRSLLACLLRSAGAALAVTPDEAATKAAYDRGFEAGKVSGGNWKDVYDRSQVEYDRQRAAVQGIEEVLGVAITEWSAQDTSRATTVAATLKLILDGDMRIEMQRQRLERAAESLEKAALSMRSQLELLS